MNRIDQSHRRKLSKTNHRQSTEHRQTTRLSDIALLCENIKFGSMEIKSEQLISIFVRGNMGKDNAVKLSKECSQANLVESKKSTTLISDVQIQIFRQCAASIHRNVCPLVS